MEITSRILKYFESLIHELASRTLLEGDDSDYMIND
ncbi:hypothetical protein BC781_107123 [Sediminitomix flava]|uniref:Uncharacterized protein n=1 Tax=Sediminitomix flava TaxID=379075 RepID=A0A315Z4X9_SEDFL|nr:hypothetical protein BC781_107123 [Sediminitomix flava]